MSGGSGTVGALCLPYTSSTWDAAWLSGRPEVLEAWFRDNTGPTVDTGLPPLRGTQLVEDQEDANVLVGRVVHGGVRITGSQVVVRDVVVRGDGRREVVSVAGGARLVALRDMEIDGDGARNSVALGGASYASVRASRLDIHGVGFDGVRLMDGSVYTNLYVHDLWQWDEHVKGRAYDESRSQDTDPHTDGMQGVRGGGVVERSWVDASGQGENTVSALLLKPDAGPLGVWEVRDNYLDGGGYVVHVHEGAHSRTGEGVVARLTGNRFGRGYRQGLFSHQDVPTGRIVKSANVWADTLLPVPVVGGPLLDASGL